MVCEHLLGLEPVPPRTKGCEECLKTGMRWVHLRLCLTCGHVGCCDSSPGKSRHKAFSSHQPSRGGFFRTRRALGVVLCG